MNHLLLHPFHLIHHSLDITVAAISIIISIFIIKAFISKFSHYTHRFSLQTFANSYHLLADIPLPHHSQVLIDFYS